MKCFSSLQNAFVVWAVVSTLGMGCASNQKNQKQPSLSKKEQSQLNLSVAAANITENDPIAAIEALNRARELDDSNPECYYLYALAYLGKNETKLALDSAKYAVRLDPKYSAAKNTIGKIYLDQGNFEEAKRYFLESASDLLFREAYLPKLNLGILYYKKTELSLAETWLTKSIADGNFNYTCLAYYYRGKVRMDRGDLKLAERDLAQSIKGSCSGLTEAHIGIGQNLIRAKKYDQARAKFFEIQRLFPSSDAYDQAAQYLKEIP